MIRGPRKPLSLPKVVGRDQVRRLLDALNPRCATGLRNRCALQLMYRAGLRVSEVCNLSPADVNLQDGYVYVQQGKGRKDRVVPLDPETVDWCRRWAASRPDAPHFLTTLRGGRLSDRYLRALCARLSAKAGVYLDNNHVRRPLHPHTLRHCFGTELVEEGFTLPEIQELMGHSSIETTRIYTHVRPQELAAKIRGRRMTG